jgi:hypothetical protein
VADEPSNSELAWRLEAIQRSVGELVGRPEYTARQEAAERRFSDLAADVAALERRHDDDIAKIHRRIDDHERDHKDSHHSWRNAIYVGIVPALVAAAAILAQLWMGAHK